MINKQFFKNIKYLELIIKVLTVDSLFPRLIGGCVRDNLLNILNYDIDIATPLLPEIVILLCNKNNLKVIPTGIKFGTVTVIIENEKFEITTLREDIKCYGRKADVKFTDDFFIDASRRDFTINALSYCYTKEKIYDYHNGLTHLKERKVIFIGNAKQRIQEDYLRILRFFRFSSKYASQLNIEGYNECCELSCFLKKISQERILSELNKLIVCSNAPATLFQMIEGKVTFNINAILIWNSTLLQDSIKIAKILDIELTISVRFALLFYKNNIEILKKELKILRFSNISIENILSIVKFIQTTDKNNYFTKLKIQWYDYFDSVNQYIIIAVVLNYIDLNQAKELSLEMTNKAIRMPINGKDLIALGYQNSDIGKKLEILKDIWLRNKSKLDKSELLEYLIK